jgi:YbbR domain-containing protein
MRKILRSFAFTVKSNIKTIITAVITSVVIWFAISLQLFPDVYITINDIPVAVNPPAFMTENNLRLAEEYDFTTSTQIRGKRYEIGTLGSGDFEAVLNLSSVTEDGEFTVDIIVTSNSDMDFEIIPTTQTERIRVERIDFRTLEITPMVAALRVVEGMQIDESGLTANPPTVTVWGEKTIIDSIVRAEVHAAHDEDLFSSVSLNGELRLFDRRGDWILNPDVTLDNENFSVSVPVYMFRTLPLNMVITGAPWNFDLVGLRAMVTLEPSELELSSPDNSIEHRSRIDVGEISLNDIDLNMLRTLTRDTIAPKLPEGYKNVSNIASFTLKFEGVEDYTEYSFIVPRENITVLNEPTGFDVEILTRELIITVVGPEDYVLSLSANDINVTLELSNIPEIADSRIDTRTVQCRINRGSNVPAWIVGYPQVDVRFTRIEAS